MARRELIAEVSLALFFITPMVGMAMSMRMRMMAITINSSINVKPLGRRCVRLSRGRLWEPLRPFESEDLRFMGFLCLVEQAGGSRPIRENATTYRREREMRRSKRQFSVHSSQFAVIGGRYAPRVWISDLREMPVTARKCELQTGNLHFQHTRLARVSLTPLRRPRRVTAMCSGSKRRRAMA